MREAWTPCARASRRRPDAGDRWLGGDRPTGGEARRRAGRGWYGTATYTSPPGFGGSDDPGGIEYQDVITISTRSDGRGAVRVSGVVATVRTYCPGPMVHDIRLSETRKHGPKVSPNGAFSFSAKGVTISGSLGASQASGRIRAGVGGCELSDCEWQARKAP